MKVFCAVAFLLAFAHAGEVGSPIAKVIQLLGDMEQKILKEGSNAQKTFEEFSEFCEDRSKDLQHAIKTGKATSAELKAEIEEETATAASLNAKIEEVSASLASDEADLAAATNLHEKEAAEFAKADKELTDVINALERAIAIIEREQQKGGAASMMQLQNAGSLTEALTIMVNAAIVSSADADKLTALIQDSQNDAGAPDAATYKSHSGGIVQTLEDLLEKAQEEQSSTRKDEQNRIHSYQMVKQSLDDSIKFANKDASAAKANLAASAEAKASASGDLEVTTNTLAEDNKSLDDLHHDCMTQSQDFEAATKSRGEELAALAKAKDIIKEATGGAETHTYSFLQISVNAAAPLQAVRLIRDLGRNQHSAALTQLALRMSSVVRSNQSGPFDKVTGLIKDMLDKLEKEAGQDASHKAYCDKEIKESTQKKEDKDGQVAKLSTKIDQMTAKSAKLKEETANLQADLAALAKSQTQMGSIRRSEKAQYKESAADLRQGIDGVKRALQVLREYYASDKAHDAAEGAGANIIGLLEVCESDFSKGLAEVTSTEESAAAAYEDQSKENQITKTTKNQDVKYKTKEATGLDKSSGEASSDRSSEQTELDAVREYLGKLNDECVSKPDTYAERKARREAELAGLKEALQILDSESFVQTRTRKHFRGAVLRP